MFKLIEGLAQNVLAIEATGKVTHVRFAPNSGHSLMLFVCPRVESYLHLAETCNECSQFWHSKVQIS